MMYYFDMWKFALEALDDLHAQGMWDSNKAHDMRAKMHVYFGEMTSDERYAATVLFNEKWENWDDALKEKQLVFDRIKKGLSDLLWPTNLAISFSDHGYAKQSIRIDTPGGLLFVEPRPFKRVKITCICLEGGLKLYTDYDEMVKVIVRTANDHSCPPWPG